MPQGSCCSRPKAICSATAALHAPCSTLPRGSASNRLGIRYSNIEPDQERSAAVLPTAWKGRPRAAQWPTGASALAMASRLVRRASDASRS